MRIFNSFLCLGFLFFASCEMLEEEEAASENNETTATKPAPPFLPEPKPEPEPEPEPKPESKPETKTKTKPEASKPQMPTFSKELLAAVKNWNDVSPKVFPLQSVKVMQDLTFKLYSSSGQLMGSASVSSGKEVVAVALKGRNLYVSPSVGSKMTAPIDIDQTDFKQGVAYLFELRKFERVRYEQQLKNRPVAQRNSSSPTRTVPNRTKPNERTPKGRTPKGSNDNSLFMDLPIPGDYGHGKFCICGDCRKKRLAQTGSLK
jgi:hypothetical protein